MAITAQQAIDWLIGQGVDPNVARQEGSYVAEQYADPGEDAQRVLEGSLGGYLQRSYSGGDPDEGGYDTRYDDPAVLTDSGRTPARTDSPWGFPGTPPGPAPIPPPTPIPTPTPIPRPPFTDLFPPGTFGPGRPIPNEPLNLDQLMSLVNQLNVEPGREVDLPRAQDLPVIEVPGIDLSSDIDRSLLSLMRGEDTSTRETESAIRTLLADIEAQERPEIPTRTLPTRGLEDFYDQGRVTRRMLTATENSRLGQQGLLSQLRSQLADAGVVGLPGAPQGLETAGARRVAERVSVPFAQELAEIQNTESERAVNAALQHLGMQSERDIAELDTTTRADIARQQGFDTRELSALQLATGWSSDKAQRVLQAAAAGTDRQRILSEIAVGTLDRNIIWNQFLAEYGLKREQMAADIQAGRLDRINTILTNFMGLLAQLRGGYIGAT